MTGELILPQISLHVLDFSHFYKSKIEPHLIGDLHHYQLLDRKINSDIKKLFCYHIIHGICEISLQKKSLNNLVFFFNFQELVDSEVVKYYDRENLKTLFYSILYTINKQLPLAIHQSTNLHFHQLTTKFTDDIADTQRKMISITEIKRSQQFTFENIRKFSRKNKLTFLSSDYFNQLKTKLLLT